jgi:hypothetical protein
MRWGSFINNFFTNRKYFCNFSSNFCFVFCFIFIVSIIYEQSRTQHEHTWHWNVIICTYFPKAKKKIIISVRWTFLWKFKENEFYYFGETPKKTNTYDASNEKRRFHQITSRILIISWWYFSDFLMERRCFSFECRDFINFIKWGKFVDFQLMQKQLSIYVLYVRFFYEYKSLQKTHSRF